MAGAKDVEHRGPARGPARRAGPACGRAGRPPRRQARSGPQSEPSRALGGRVILGGHEDLGRFLGHLAGGGIDAAIEQLAVYEPAGRSRLGGDRRPEGLEPGETLAAGGRRSPRRGRVEAAPGAAMAGRPCRIHGQEERVPVAIERDRDEAQDVAAGLALAPERSRDREWKWTSPVASVAARASRSTQASIRTRPSARSWTTPGTRPVGSPGHCCGIETDARVDGRVIASCGRPVRRGPGARRRPSRP